jgi:hypothetical protein
MLFSAATPPTRNLGNETGRIHLPVPVLAIFAEVVAVAAAVDHIRFMLSLDGAPRRAERAECDDAQDSDRLQNVFMRSAHFLCDVACWRRVYRSGFRIFHLANTAEVAIKQGPRHFAGQKWGCDADALGGGNNSLGG